MQLPHTLSGIVPDNIEMDGTEMTEFKHFVAIKVNKWGKGLLGEHVQIEEYDHLYFGSAEEIAANYKVIDKLIRAGKRENIEISLYEAGEDFGDQLRRLFVRLDHNFREYGTAEVGECDFRGCFDTRVHMDAKTVRFAMYSVLDEVAMKLGRSEAV